MDETFTHHGVTVKIQADCDPQDPRKMCDELGTMFCCHGRYNLGDKQFRSGEELRAALPPKNEIAVILPLYLYDHSGITMSTTPFSCPWDSGQVGVIFITKEKARHEYGKLTAAKLKKITEYLVNEVKEYDTYLTGDVWSYVVAEDTDDEDSCSGFYGYDTAVAEAKQSALRIAMRQQTVYM